ncbi:porin [Labrys sp. ZIDIC5]|uniref:porin n=1 Tax=Labrys sedimenti TaxID=3106036 RepID=UPI002ACA7327|nr:porin [Labrys sp. ZIDIC5]MDZ5452156.1 porin [Labrys sp. ZIDIC5]
MESFRGRKKALTVSQSIEVLRSALNQKSHCLGGHQMTIRSLLLGASAGFALIGAAQAADLPMTKGEAVEYVKVCSAFGPGFFYIPGSDTCLKIGGEIRADYRAFAGNGFSRNDDRSAFNTQARIWFDARTETDWGLLRSYFQINADSHPISNQGRGGIYNDNRFTIDKAFIQFGGLTAGYAHSFFGFYDNEYGDTIWAPYYAEQNTVNLIAYTAQFGGGFSATLSIEDGRDHRVGGTSTPVDINGTLYGYREGGQQVPDVVAQLRWDQSWGSIAVQAAGHQSRSGTDYTITTPGANPGDPPIVTPVNVRRSNKYGYAVGATGLIKIPAIDNGHFIVEGQYANGALDYLGAGATWLANSDSFVNSRGRIDRGKGWSITAELGGNITPVLGANLVGSYIDTQYDHYLGNGKYGLKEYTIAGNLTYTIVKGLTVAGEVAWTHGKVDDGIIDDGELNGRSKYNVLQGGVRLKRTF